MSEQDFNVPDRLGVFIGWRAWMVDPSEPGVLRSMNGTPWTPGRALVATCGRCRDRCPGERCSCGIYSKRTRAQIEDSGYPQFDLRFSDNYAVYGPVWLWGGVVPGDDGFRAAKAYPKRLIVPYTAMKIAKPLYESYYIEDRQFGVKVENVSHIWKR